MASYPRKQAADPPAKVRRRANGEGSIYHVQSEDRWRAAISWIDGAGCRRRRILTGQTQADVRRRLDKLRSDLNRGITPAPSGTVGQYLVGWLDRERQRVRPSTWRQREQHVRSYIVPAVGSMQLAKLMPTDVERMTASLVESGRSPRTAAHTRTILRRALGDALRDGLVHRNVAALARPPRVPQTEIVYLSLEALRVLLAAASEDRVGPLVAVATTTGLRQGELLGLAWADVDLAHGALVVRRSMARAWNGAEPTAWALSEPKTGRSRRTVNLPGVAVAALHVEKEWQDAARAQAGSIWQDVDGLVFTDELGQPLKAWRVTEALHALLERAGLPSVPFQALRHSAATALLGAGVPLRVVSDLLGHSTVTITAQHYAAVVPELRREAALAMDKVLGRTSRRRPRRSSRQSSSSVAALLAPTSASGRTSSARRR